jgi:hypothetical protein
MLELIVAFRDTDTARACYDLLAPRAADAGAAGIGLVVIYGSLDWPLARRAAPSAWPASSSRRWRPRTR